MEEIVTASCRYRNAARHKWTLRKRATPAQYKSYEDYVAHEYGVRAPDATESRGFMNPVLRYWKCNSRPRDQDNVHGRERTFWRGLLAVSDGEDIPNFPRGFRLRGGAQ